ncbi:Transmembrane protein 42 [Madurella fahalii]|uniref:Transmembrane protein 42 n=1 Tax=Madurella fahalii TaxID=1157608 RepID=A0ABQ0GNL2_9PEZI
MPATTTTQNPASRRGQAPTATPSSSYPGSSSSSSFASLKLKKRVVPGSAGRAEDPDTDAMSRSDEELPLLDRAGDARLDEPAASVSWTRRNQWIVFALASGACAAFNGVFAKLTTTELTASFSLAIARVFGLESIEGVVEFVVRCIFFGLNLTFNGVMWTLFTTALARGNSTTQVSIMNTSSNFVLTAILGVVIFSEALPPLWWVGAAMLIAGNVIVGRKDEGEPSKSDEDEPLIRDAAMGSGVADVVASSSRAVGVDGASGEEDVEKDEDVADLGLDMETEE